MSRYPYGNPNYPPPQGPIYPSLYNPANAPPPGQPNVPPNYPVPGYNVQHSFQPGYSLGQQPAAMSYPGITPAPTAPRGHVTPHGAFGYQSYPYVTPTQSYDTTIEWVPTTPQNASILSEKAVVAGYEGHDGSPLWVIRSQFQGDLIPGKLCVKHFSAYVPWGGKENAVQNIEVCCARPERVRWLESRDGVIPPNAVMGGNTAAGEPLYIGRAREQGSLTPGKVHPSHKVLYISFAGQELPHKVYEILCTV
ncbi:uncharacterized protein LOC114246481 [Bombyx mandarina]|uniref:Uncharacterized protein n=2 Tax=Bombyx TaxID=7090 RepID=A0A8R2ANB9_BOMMO|nr:uncharacterized protein LOC101737963 [Bombyx mori]XP_028034821.1 uncharacterized protein LOC114246481 [Bombyx mandarina]